MKAPKNKNKDIAKIEKMLGLDEIPVPRNREEVIKYNKKMIGNLLKNAKATKVEIAYDGGGDNGSVESVKILAGKKEVSVKGVMVDYYECHGTYTGSGFKDEVKKRNDTLDQAIENFAYGLLDSIPYDWINNDGGYGTLVFDVKKGVISLDHNQREYTYNDEEGHEDDEPEVEIIPWATQW